MGRSARAAQFGKPETTAPEQPFELPIAPNAPTELHCRPNDHAVGTAPRNQALANRRPKLPHRQSGPRRGQGMGRREPEAPGTSDTAGWAAQPAHQPTMKQRQDAKLFSIVPEPLTRLYFRVATCDTSGPRCVSWLIRRSVASGRPSVSAPVKTEQPTPGQWARIRVAHEDVSFEPSFCGPGLWDITSSLCPSVGGSR